MINLKELPSKLRRVTSGGRVIDEVDGLRFLAIFPVVIQHLSERMERNSDVHFALGFEYDITSFIASRGFIGVYIFFVISGFILALPFASQAINNTRSINLKSYYIRRLTRLEPPYIAIMTLFFIILALTKFSFDELWGHYFASLAYSHNIIFQKWSIMNPPVWTLEVEVQFYLMAPFLAMGIFKISNVVHRRLATGFSIISILILQDFFGWAHHPYNMTLLGHLHYFFIGFLLTDIFLVEWNGGKTKGNRRIYDILALVSFSLLIYVWSWDHHLINRLIFAFLLIVLFISVFKGVTVNRIFRNRWITAVGGMCYTIYLIHLPLAEFLIQYSKGVTLGDSYSLNLIVQLLLFLPALFVVSVLFFLTLEKPCMDKNWPKKLIAAIVNFKNNLIKPA